MMRSIGRVLFVFALLCLWAGAASAAQYVFDPSDRDIEDLAHEHYYTWGLDFSVPEDETIVGASISFNDIRNWNSSSNDLWVHLLDGAPAGLERYRDNRDEAVDAFAGQGVLLNHWQDLPAWPHDITYTFDTSDLDALVSYLLDGSVGFGFDPDCHFYNSGISFMVETTPVPVPASLGLLGMGFVGLLGFSRRRRKM